MIPTTQKADLVGTFPSATELRADLRAGRLSARECLEQHVQRIDVANPEVNALVTLDVESGRARADELDRARAQGEPLGLLHGLPVAIKDTHPTAGMRTTFGSPIHAENVPALDALIVQRLKAAGAIVVGKSNTPEFAAGSHTTNAVFGATRNPHDLRKSAGGSSGGAAAALAAGMVALADGSDLGGSLRNPASFCGVVGLRPTPGRVPMWPAWDLWDTCAVQGPMARTVPDLALALDAMAGPTLLTPTVLPREGSWFDRLSSRRPASRVAVLDDLGGIPVEAPVLEALAAAADRFAGLDQVTVAGASLDIRPAIEVFSVLRAAMFVGRYGTLLDDSPDLIGENVRWNIEVGRHMSAGDVAVAGMRRSSLRAEFMGLFDSHDYLVTYTSQVLPFDVDLPYPDTIAGVQMPDYLGWMSSCAAFSVYGVPVLAVPVGLSDGLPVGIQIIGRPGDELGLLQLGQAFMATGE